MERFGKLIADARNRRGWTVRQAGSALKRDPSFISRIENARNSNPPSSSEFRELTSGLGVSPLEGLIALGYLERSDLPDSDAAAWDAGLPADVRELLQNITWTRESTDGMKAVLRMMRGMQLAAEAPAGMPDTYDDLEFEGRVPKEALKGTERT